MFKTRSNLHDFVLFCLAKYIFWKEEGKLSLKYPCINVRTQSLYVSSRLRTFSFENNGFECALKVLRLDTLNALQCTVQVVFISMDSQNLKIHRLSKAEKILPPLSPAMLSLHFPPIISYVIWGFCYLFNFVTL